MLTLFTALLALSASQEAAQASGSVTVAVQGRLEVVRVGAPGEVTFTNSVTGRPVKITFELGPEEFVNFAMWTDADTEGYYTGGEYHINDRLKTEHTSKLSYCSEVGIQVRLGELLWKIKDNCLTLSVAPPGSRT